MRGGRWTFIVALAVLCSCLTWTDAFARTPCEEEACDEMKAKCATATDYEIFEAAYYLEPNYKPSFGSCYIHDRYACPDCACHFYIKFSYGSGDKGYDGGTGCVGMTSTTTYEQARQQTANLLRQLCLEGKCCCPNVVATACSSSTPVSARDSVTGSCCQFPNECSIPSGWTAMPFGC